MNIDLTPEEIDAILLTVDSVERDLTNLHLEKALNRFNRIMDPICDKLEAAKQNLCETKTLREPGETPGK